MSNALVRRAARPRNLARALGTAAAGTGKPRLKHYRLTAVGTGAKCVSRTGSGFTIESDLPKATGGGDSAPEPVYYLLAALASCETATATFVARKLGIPIKRLHFVDLRATRDERGALHLPITEDPALSARLLSITGRVLVESDDATLSGEQLQLLERQVHRRCPVANMVVASGTDLDLRFEGFTPTDATPRDG